jgi:hypothetical protein
MWDLLVELQGKLSQISMFPYASYNNSLLHRNARAVLTILAVQGAAGLAIPNYSRRRQRLPTPTNISLASLLYDIYISIIVFLIV